MPQTNNTPSAITMTDAEATRMVKGALRKAFPHTKFEVSASRGMIRWTDDGPSIEQVQGTIVAAGCVEAETGWNGDLRLYLQGRSLWFDLYNAAERAADEKDFACRMQEQQARQQREAAAVAAAKQAKRKALRGPGWSPPTLQDQAENQKAYAAFESLRPRAEADVATNAERQHRPSWAPPLIIEGELLEACIGLGLLTADAKPITRLWASFADPRKSGRVLREQGSRHTLPGITCRGFQLHAGGERCPTSEILFEAQRMQSGEWQFGPSRYAHDYHSPRRAAWERLVRKREYCRSIASS